MSKPLTRRSLLAVVALAVAVLLGPASARADEASDLISATQLYQTGNYEKAALMLFDIAEGSGTNQDVQFQAQSFLAKSLFKLHLFHSALYYDLIIIDVGPKHPGYRDAVQNTLDVMDAVGDKAIVPSLLDKEYNDNFAKLPKQVIDRVNFLVALWGHEQKRLEDSIEFLKVVGPDSEAYPRALYLRGVQLAQAAKSGESKKNKEAADYFQKVMALQNGTVQYRDLDDLKGLATLGLARVRYAEGKFSEAELLYKKVPRFSRMWRDALFEGAYAAFMNDEYGKALGNLMNLHAPVAGDQFVPESWLLKAYVYYFTCLFDESKAALDHLQSTYPKTNEEVKALLTAKLPPEVYYELLTAGKSGDYVMPVNVRNELLVDEGLRGRRSYVAALDDEAKKLDSISSWHETLLQKALSEAVAQQKVKLIQVAGKSVAQALKKISFTLDDIDAQADILGFEMAKRQADLLARGDYDEEQVLAKQKLYRPSMPRTGTEYWPFDGEFWPDELGFYQYTIKNACPADEVAGPAPSAGK